MTLADSDRHDTTSASGGCSLGQNADQSLVDWVDGGADDADGGGSINRNTFLQICHLGHAKIYIFAKHICVGENGLDGWSGGQAVGCYWYGSGRNAN